MWRSVVTLHLLIQGPLCFSLAGLRAVMGAGYCQMNELTIIQTTQVGRESHVTWSCMLCVIGLGWVGGAPESTNLLTLNLEFCISSLLMLSFWSVPIASWSAVSRNSLNEVFWLHLWCAVITNYTFSVFVNTMGVASLRWIGRALFEAFVFTVKLSSVWLSILSFDPILGRRASKWVVDFGSLEWISTTDGDTQLRIGDIYAGDSNSNGTLRKASLCIIHYHEYHPASKAAVVYLSVLLIKMKFHLARISVILDYNAHPVFASPGKGSPEPCLS